MEKRKRYSKTEDLFILNEMAKANQIKECSEKLATALARTPLAIRQRYQALKKIYPDHPAYVVPRTSKQISEEATKSGFRKFIDKIFHRNGGKSN